MCVAKAMKKEKKRNYLEMFEYFIAPDNVTIPVLMIQKSWRPCLMAYFVGTHWNCLREAISMCINKLSASMQI